ncbi:hypothetical protein R6Q59_015496, partial [Mikania micrantha]
MKKFPASATARGLSFLHDPKDTQHRVLHRDIKSSNILLDENWTAKVSDFGLSKLGPANQPHSYLISYVVGTPGYCDPLYWELGFLSKESDVYSFGVVLFEILCGRLCYECCKHELTKILVPKWRRCYDEKRLDEVILPGLKDQMDPGSLKSFSAIAYHCVKKAREERPTMAEIVKELELSLKLQEIFESRTSLMHNDQTDQSLNDQRLEFAKRPVELVNRFEDQVDDDCSQLQPFINGDDSDDYCDSEADETSSSWHHGDGGQPRSEVLYEHYKYYKCSNVVLKWVFRMSKATFHMICG